MDVDIRLTNSHTQFMKDELRFMNELVRIVGGALRLDVEKVRNYTAFLADKLEEGGETTTAGRLRKLLQESDHQLRPTDVRFARALPVDGESRFPLLEHVKRSATPEPQLFLSQAQLDVVTEFLSVAKSFSATDSADHSGALNLLMYGPPGTGKSRLARHIAEQLGLDLYVARLDGLMSSLLGSTSKNIRALFDFASKTPCVLFLDEFDAIAKLRGDSQELGELKRVVNSFLQNLDTVGRQSIVLAATNHDELLDAAVWRRFTYRLKFDLPSMERRQALLTEFLRPHTLDQAKVAALADLSEGFSGSDIREATARLKRRLTATGGKAVDLKDAFAVIRNFGLAGNTSALFAATLSSSDSSAIVQVLRARNRKLYSFALVADLLGVSKATAQRLATREVFHVS